MLRRKEKARLRLEVRDALGGALFSDFLERLTLPEETVLALSVEFFGDPEPCEIHRSAVLSRAHAEIEAALPTDAPREAAALGARVRMLLGAWPDAATVCLRREAGR